MKVLMVAWNKGFTFTLQVSVEEGQTRKRKREGSEGRK